MALSQQDSSNDPYIRKHIIQPRKFCFISGCRNSTLKYPDIIFFDVPYHDEMRKRQWLAIAKREVHANNKVARWYCCEEHFDLEKDLENFAQVKSTGEFPVLKKDVVPHKLISSTEPSLPVPARKANVEEWDKFKRRLIRAVSRLLYKENKPEDEVWAFLRKETGCNCLLLWDRMRSLTIKKLSRHLLADDRAAAVPAVARMTLTDWLMCDLVLVHEDIDVIGRFHEPSVSPRDHRPLISLFSLVQRFNVEALEGESLALAWSSAAAHYNTEGRQCSPMLLQRRWYQLKEWTRTHFYEFWQLYRGNKAKFEQAQAKMPGKLQQAIARRFPHVITKTFEDWHKLVSWEKVILPDHFESLMTRELPPPCNDDDPDLIILDPVIETIDVDSDEDSCSKDAIKDVEDSYSNLEETIEDEAENMAECGFDPSKVKSEPIDNIDIEETKIDKPSQILDSTTKILEEFDKAFETVDDGNNAASLEDAIPCDADIECDQDVTQRADEIAQDAQDLVTEPIEEVNKTIENFDETAQSGFDVKMPMITNVFGNVGESELSNLSSKSAEAISKQVSEVSEEDEDEMEDIIRICDDSVDDMIKFKFKEFLDMKKNIEKNEVAVPINVVHSLDDVEPSLPHLDEAVSAIKTEVNAECSEEVKIELNEGSSLVDQFDEASEVVSFVDDGIKYSDDEESEDKYTGTISNKDMTQIDDETPKFDLKLLMQPVVYTTKLDHMQSLFNENIENVNVKTIIDNIIRESKPIHARSLGLTQQDTKERDTEIKLKTADSSDDKFTNAELNERQLKEDYYEEEEIEVKLEISDEMRVKTTSHLLQKPRNREYAPIQICKNPDFNTRLKRLNMGFYNFDKNIQYLNRCKPLTVDVHKAFESKLINGTLYLKPGEVNVNTTIEEDNTDHRTNIIPFAGPVQSLMNVPKATAQELIDEREASLRCIAEAETEDDDVVQTSRLTGVMPRPCLLATRPSIPPAPDTTPTPVVPPAPFATPTFAATPINAKVYAKPHEKAKQKPNPFLPRQKNPAVSWLSSKAAVMAVKFDEFLIAPDTLTKMLIAMDSNNDEQRHLNYKEFIENKKKIQQRLYMSGKKPTKIPVQKHTQLGRPRKKKDKPTTPPAQVEILSQGNSNTTTENNGDPSKNYDHACQEIPNSIEKPDVETDIEVVDVDKSNDESHDGNSSDLIIDLDESKNESNKPKKRVRTVYCCWARRKMTNHRYIKHPCPIENCTCCCMDAYHKKMSETRRQQQEKAANIKESSVTKVPKINIKQNLTKSQGEISSKPVAHIKIIPKTNVQTAPSISLDQDQDPKLKVAKVVKQAIPKKPSLIIDGTPQSMLHSKAMQSPIYLGKNKILLTNMKFPDHIDGTKPRVDVSPQKVIEDLELPLGVQIVLLPNGLVTFTVDSEANITPSQLASLPQILSKVQERMNKLQSPLIKSPAKGVENNTINTSDEIVISDDDEPTTAKILQRNQVSETEVTENVELEKNPIGQESNTNIIGETNLSRKTLLSDLMEMSGISFEDTMPQQSKSESSSQVITTEDTLIPQSIQNDKQVLGLLPATAGDLSLDAIPVDAGTHVNFINTNATAPLVTVSTDNLLPTSIIPPEDVVLSNDGHTVDATSADVAAENSQSNATGADLKEPEIGTKLSENTAIGNDNIIDKEQSQNNNPIVVDGIFMNIGPNQHTILPLFFPKEFSAVTSFAKLKYVCENNGSFFKMDLESGSIVPINVCLKKRSSMIAKNAAGPKRVSIKMVPKKVLLTKEFREVRQKAVANETLQETTTTTLPNNDSQISSISPRPLKLIRAFTPGILRKRALLGENPELVLEENIEVIKEKRKQRLMARIVGSSQAHPRIDREPFPIEILDSDEDNGPDLQTSEGAQKTSASNLDDSSDDEPLSKLAKKLHSQNSSQSTVNSREGISSVESAKNKSPEPTVNTSNKELEAMEVDQEISHNIDLLVPESNQSILDSEQCLLPGLMPSAATDCEQNDESSGDENCILGV